MADSKDWGGNKLMGDIGESIVKFLINSMKNWECIPFGVENHIMALKASTKENHLDEASKIKSMPDFVAVDKQKQTIHLIEAKYRSSASSLYGFRYMQIETYLKYWKEAKLVFVYPSPPYFSVVSLSDVKFPEHFRGKNVTPGGTFYCWKFEEIQKDIRTLFPELSQENMDRAIKMMPGNVKTTIQAMNHIVEPSSEVSEKTYCGYTKEQLMIMGYDEMQADYMVDSQ